MKLVSGIVDSGFFAQSALSAEVAAKDSLGRNISETYLTGVDQVISSYATATNVNSAIITNLNDLELSARIAYNARTAYYDQNGVNLANATNSAKSGYAASAWINEHSSDYQTTAGMTAYQSAGDYYSASNPSGFLVADDITGKLDASVYATDSGSFLTAVPDTYLQNTDLSTEDGKVTAISGIPLSAGGSDVPEGVMVESGLEYNAINQISGYNGSAIAQYGHEAQWLVHDDTLVHASNSAQYALGVNLSAVAQLLGVDETLLYSGNAFRVSNGGSFNVTTALSENVSSFKKIVFRMSNGGIDTSEIVCTPVSNGVTFNRIFSYGGQWVGISGAITGNGMSANIGGGNGNNAATCHTAGNWWDYVRVESIYGIGRKA